VTVSVRDARGTARDREWIESVYRDYLDDLSPLNTGVFSATSLGEIGYSESDQLARWFGDSSVNPLVILRGAEPVGFAMVARGSAAPGRVVADYRMAEFFVARTFRRRGVGRLAVELILNRFAGQWEITEYLRNPVAVAFWRRVVANYTNGRFQEPTARYSLLMRGIFRRAEAKPSCFCELPFRCPQNRAASSPRSPARERCRQPGPADKATEEPPDLHSTHRKTL